MSIMETEAVTITQQKNAAGSSRLGPHEQPQPAVNARAGPYPSARAKMSDVFTGGPAESQQVPSSNPLAPRVVPRIGTIYESNVPTESTSEENLSRRRQAADGTLATSNNNNKEVSTFTSMPRSAYTSLLTSRDPGYLSTGGLVAPVRGPCSYPTNLYKYCDPEPWDRSRFRDIRRLSPAIHGEVRLAYDRNNQLVIVKVIRNSAMRPRGHGELENALIEVGAMQYLFSAHAVVPPQFIARLIGVYRDLDHTYMVTEYCVGGELFREVIARGYFYERVVKAIALQLAFALLSLHRNGICHRDVSLENTLLQSDRTIRLIDFGQAEPMMDERGNRVRMTGSAGKAYYRAPEMTQPWYDGPPTDVFALGVQIFIMAGGSPPWQEAVPSDERYRRLTSSKTALNDALVRWGRRDRMSDALVDLLTWIFISTPEQRPTIEDLFLHPWFSFDGGLWRWVYRHWPAACLREEAARVEAYLQLYPEGKWFLGPVPRPTADSSAQRTSSRPVANSNGVRSTQEVGRQPGERDRFHIHSSLTKHLRRNNEQLT